MITLRSHLGGSWFQGQGKEETLVNPATEEPLATVVTGGADLGAALDFARRRGGEALRALTFAVARPVPAQEAAQGDHELLPS